MLSAPLSIRPAGAGHDGSAVPRAAAQFLNSLTDSRPIGVAVSGGSDSTGLLVALCAAASPGRIHALTVDHGLRRESAEEAAAVAALAGQLGVRHETLRWTGEKPSAGLQAAARAARYRLLSDAARRLGLAAIVTAHTAGDQAETLAMRRARTGLREGQTGIPPATLHDESVWFLRPFLHLARGAIRAYLEASGQAWIEDPSNRDTRFERVRVRAAAPSGEPLARHWRARREAAERLGAVLTQRAQRDEDDLFSFDVEGLDDGLALAGLRALVEMAGGRARGVDRHGLDRLREFVASGDRSRLTVGRTLLSRRADVVHLRRERRDLPSVRIEGGGETVWDGRFRVINRGARYRFCVPGSGRYGILPDLSATNGEERDEAAGGAVTRLCGRVSRLMPVFDAARGEALAALAARPGFPPCPWPNWMSVADPI